MTTMTTIDDDEDDDDDDDGGDDGLTFSVALWSLYDPQYIVPVLPIPYRRHGLIQTGRS